MTWLCWFGLDLLILFGCVFCCCLFLIVGVWCSLLFFVFVSVSFVELLFIWNLVWVFVLILVALLVIWLCFWYWLDRFVLLYWLCSIIYLFTGWAFVLVYLCACVFDCILVLFIVLILLVQVWLLVWWFVLDLWFMICSWCFIWWVWVLVWCRVCGD